MRQDDGDSAFWFGAGMLLGASGVIFACACLGVLNGAKGYCDSESLLYRFQSFIAGIMALSGAGLTVYYIGRQIRQVDRLEEDRLRRRNLADRAMLPGALSRLCDYAEQSLTFLRSIPVSVEDGHFDVGRPAKPVPKISDEALIILRRFIETANSDASMPLVKIMRHLQVLDSRLRGVAQKESPENVIDATAHPFLLAVVVDALELLTRCNLVFGFARFEVSTIRSDITVELLSNAAAGYFFDLDQRYRGLDEAITRRCQYLAEEKD